MRKRSVQLDMFDRKPRRRTRGVRLGRPPKKRRAGAPHKRRPEIDGQRPVHVVLRVTGEIGNLRKRHMYTALREATLTVARRELNFREHGAFRIVHISIQSNHIHLLVEAGDKVALSRGMQSFQISAAKHLNRAASRGLARRRRGNVFTDRFHQEIIKCPTQARNALAYVLNNWRKHREDRGKLERTWNVDPFSTGVLFDGWTEREDEVLMWRWRESYDPLVVHRPKSWILREGWRKGGPTIPFREIPSSHSRP